MNKDTAKFLIFLALTIATAITVYSTKSGWSIVLLGLISLYFIENE